MSNMELSIHFFLQVAAILAACRIVGFAAKRLGQPQVVGEMIAGLLLGPTLFGWLLPDVQGQLFPAASMSILYTVSQVGLVLYMFVIGLEFEVNLLKQHARSAAAVSLAGIIAPLTLGGVLAWFLHADRHIFPAGVSTVAAALFLGSAMAVTAFPVLSRIVHERGLIDTPLGTLVLAAGSIDDVVAWCLLAVMLALFDNSASVALIAIGGGTLYTVCVLLLGRPLLRQLAARVEQTRRLSGPILTTVLILVMVAAWYTDTIGIHAVFGAFILGVAMPRGRLVQELRRAIEPVTVSALLPLFFTYSGLNTRLGLVATPALWALTVLVILIACLGKGVACWGAAVLSGEWHRDSQAIGMLMNARGLMELILLNIGLARGVITPTLFTIMVLMAIVTTFVASPLFEVVYGRYLPCAATSSPTPDEKPSPHMGSEPYPFKVI